MTVPDSGRQRDILRGIARRAMIERGLLPEFSPQALAELERIRAPATFAETAGRDLRELPWCSIDNDSSRDLDQLTAAEHLPGGEVKIMVAIADVDAVVRKASSIDDHARQNTTSVYTAGGIFPMLPERLSTDLTSLNAEEDRSAVVVEMVIAGDGSLQGSDIYGATVRSHAKLAYRAVAAWLDGTGPLPDRIRAVEGLDENLRIQDRIARSMRRLRQEQGALTFQTVETRVVFDGDELKGLEVAQQDRAQGIIEDFMIAANGVAARYLAARKFPSVRRVVRTPRRWERMVEIASDAGFVLPAKPDSLALERFLVHARAADPLGFPDLSLSIIKLMGPGEYTVELPGEPSEGHFGLAVKDYTHSTAPNRRYPDLVTQRLLKAALSGGPAPYGRDELAALARHCTVAEDAARKVERQVEKSAAAMLMQGRIGDRFDAVVTGAAAKGTWVRLPDPPIEGRLVQGFERVDVGHRIRVELVHTEVERGFIDFKRVE